MTQDEGDGLILPIEIASWDKAPSEKEWGVEQVGQNYNIQHRDLVSHILPSTSLSFFIGKIASIICLNN